jgi:hypothetical protein
MSESSNTLVVEAADANAEITVLDGNLNRILKGIGKVEQDLPAGIYKVHVRVGPALKEQLVSLDQDRIVNIETLLRFPSPIPLNDTSRTREYHSDAAKRASATPQDSLGTGASVLVFAREWTPDERGSTNHPAAGLSFLDWSGEICVDIVARAEFRPSTAMAPDPCASWRADLNPGAYRLRLNRPDGTALERAVFAARGQQTQVFVLQTDYADLAHGPQRGPDLETAAVTISPSGQFLPDNRHARLAELARYALTQSRRFLSEQTLDEIRREKFDDPMLGLLGAHLLLRDKPDDPALFDTVTGNLLRLLGPNHPDVRVLWLRRRDSVGLDDLRLLSPPMLRHSWDLVVDESFERPDLIPPQSPSDAIADKILPTSPWLVWRAGSQASSGGELLEDRVNAFADAIGGYLRARAHQKVARLKAAPRSVMKRAARVLYDALPRSVAARLPTIDASDAPERAPSDVRPRTELDQAAQRELARTLGLPRRVLDTMLKEYRH